MIIHMQIKKKTIKIDTDFSLVKMQAGRQWGDSRQWGWQSEGSGVTGKAVG